MTDKARAFATGSPERKLLEINDLWLTDEQRMVLVALDARDAELASLRNQLHVVTNLDTFCERCQIAYMRVNYGMCPTCVMDKANEALSNENQRVPAQVDRLQEMTAELVALREENQRMRAVVQKAIELAEEGISYTPEYFRDKWGMDKEMAEIKAALSAAEQKGAKG